MKTNSGSKTLKAYPRILIDIKKEGKEYIFIGETPLDFGLFHPWQVGPYKTIKEGLLDFNKYNK